VKCYRCDRGAEACEWCRDDETAEGICDCGLVDLGAHLLDCEARSDKRWVVRMDYEDEPR